MGFFDFVSSVITHIITTPTWTVVREAFAVFGWIIFFFLLLFLGLYFLEELKENKYTESWKWVVYAIDIPLLNVQTPLAVEQMFAHLAGAHEAPGVRDRFKYGYKQRWFSLEIISIEGYIQFLVRTESRFRDLVEAAVYAQYPEAEIVEVEDYVDQIPTSFPNETHDIWISDFGLTEHDGMPIRTYREFEHSIAKDTVLKDPMGTFLESFSRIGRGEQMWFQILVQPTSNSWKEKSIKKIKELIGEKKEESLVDGVSDKLVRSPIKGIEYVADQFFKAVSSGEEIKTRDEPQNMLSFLTPGQTKLVEAMEMKIGKLGFKTKLRGAYVARKDVFSPERGVHALIGAINQYNIPSANSIVPQSSSKKPTAKQSNKKKTILMKAYKKRKMNVGANPFILNIEELATIWHFPMSHVKTPLVQKAANKPAEPPVGLPLEMAPADLGGPLPPGEHHEMGEVPKPSGFVTDTGEVVEYS